MVVDLELPAHPLSEADKAELVAALDCSPSDPGLAFVEIALAMGKDLQCDFVGADLRRYPLRGQDLTGVNLQGADLRDADLRGAIGFDQPGVQLDGAMIGELPPAPPRPTLRGFIDKLRPGRRRRYSVLN